MGQEIDASEFSRSDFVNFRHCLEEETARLADWFARQAFSDRDLVAGFEFEAWLIDGDLRPLSANREFLARLGDPMAVPELARFNFELNTEPVALTGDVFRRVHAALSALWGRCREGAAALGGDCLLIGILPTLERGDLNAGAMSDQNRYRALNEQVLAQRKGRPIRLDIRGTEHLRLAHDNVMLEAATTSLQVHLKVSQARAARYYNLAQAISAATVAVAANSPYLFGQDLWDETRIPLFEQSVEVGGLADADRGPVRRVSFGNGYVRESLFEVFQENLQHYPALLPIWQEAAREQLVHLRLHNGTIWRWNRPLVGFDDDGTPHLRIEHRVMASGPSLVDALADTAFYFGLLVELAEARESSPLALPFPTARDNFYAAARHGLRAHVTWFDGRRWPLRDLLQRRLLPLARQGLLRLGVEAADVDDYLGVIEGRVRNACTGADWQRAYVARHGRDMAALTEAYRRRQLDDRPVHDWDI